MSPERWQQVEELFHAAQEQPRQERAQFLDERCQSDPDLRNEVESLLIKESRADRLLDAPAWGHTISLSGISSGRGATLSPGEQLGPWRITRLLGRGGMGEVYHARDTRLGREVALKLLPDDRLRDPERRRFLQEARSASALNHPNIVTFYDLAEVGGRQVLVMEYVPGKTLDHLVPRTGLPMQQVLEYAVQVADALAAAHKTGVIHRDIKPANIIVSDAGPVKLLDFGLAKIAEREARAEETALPFSAVATGEGVIVGTLSYMSPEQVQGRPVDARTDLFSFGCVLYAMVTGKPAFSGDSAASIISAVLRDEPGPASELRAGVPSELDHILRRCLRKDPERRFQSAADLKVALLEVREQDESRPAAPVVRRSWSVATAALGILLVLAGGAAAWMAFGRGEVFENPLANARFSRLTDFPGSEIEPAISRDGKFVAFLSDRDGPFDVWAGQVGSGRFLNLSHGAAGQVRAPYRSVGFAPSGSDIWLAGGDPGSRVRLLPLMGGEPRNFLAENASNLAWSPDGMRLAFHTRDPGDPTFVADQNGSNARQVFISEPDVHNHYPTWSPDGQWIYFVRGRPDIREMDLWRIQSSGGKPERMTEHNNDVAFPTPVDARTVLYVARQDDGSGPWLWALDTVRKRTRRISFGLEKYTSVAASSDGRRFVATISNPSATLWSVPILKREATDHEAKPLAIPTLHATAPRCRGSSLFYFSSSGEGEVLWRYQSGRALEILRAVDSPLFAPPEVSPDGTRVAVVLRKQGKLRLHTVSADGAELQLLTATLDVRGAVSWSPDGAWIAAGGDDGHGPGLFRIPVKGGAPVRLLSGVARNAVWSPRGRMIVYTGPNVASTAPLLAINADGSQVQLPKIEVRREGERARFTPDGTALIYMQGIRSTQDFWYLDLSTNKVRRLTRFENKAAMRTFDVSPDGTQIIFDRLQDNSDIVLIELPDKGR